ncbi:MAG TPA: sulfite exporter TauE/SafE family protein [Acetobacteraceae bacterium]|jgi:hypothetical protein|nr:sulfite exporter TauE/SafE family protein [Acetobacteraceae bacterium]
MHFATLDLLYAASGLFVGLLVGQTGVGGGSLMTPLLVLLFGIHPATAVGTDLLYASVTKVAGTAVHGANRTIDWRIVGRLATGSLPGCAVTLFFVSRFDPLGPQTAAVLSLVLGVVLVATAASIFFRARLLALIGPHLDGIPPRRTARLTVLTGAIVGVAVSVTSIGAGALAVTAVFALYPRLPARTIVGSDIAHAVPLTLLAGIGHLIMGSVDTHLLLVLLCGSVPGVLIGSALTSIVPDFVTRPLLATVLVIVGLRLVI